MPEQTAPAELLTAETAALRARVDELEAQWAALVDQLGRKLHDHRAASTRNFTTGEYKNPAREGYDRGLTDALILIDTITEEASR